MAKSAEQIVNETPSNYSSTPESVLDRVKKVTKQKFSSSKKNTGKVTEAGRRFMSTRNVRKTGTGALSLLGAFGVPLPRASKYNPYQTGKGQGRKYDRPGRPAGTGKYQKAYGMNVYEYRKLQAQKKSMAQVQAQKEAQSLSQRGYSQEDIQKIQMAKQARKEQVMQQPVDELEYEKMIAENSVSPNTQRILDRLKWVQQKAQRDDINMQRIQRERRMVADAGNLLKARNLFGPDSAKFNILETEGNILTAPNMFKEGANAEYRMTTKRLNVLQTREGGNNLKFF